MPNRSKINYTKFNFLPLLMMDIDINLLNFLKDVIPYGISYIREKKSQKIDAGGFYVWLKQHNLELAEELNKSNKNIIYIKALLNESVPKLNSLLENDQIIKEYLLDQNNSLKLIHEKLDDLLSEQNSTDPRYQELIESMLSSSELIGLNDNSKIELAAEKIKSFNEYSKQDKSPLSTVQKNREYNDLVSEGKLNKALELIRGDDSDNNEFMAKKLYHEGELWYYLSEYQQAKESFRNASILDSRNPKYLKRLASIESDFGNYTLSLEHLTKAYNLIEADDQSLAHERAHILNDLGKTHEGLKHFSKAYELYEESLSLTEHLCGKDNEFYVTTLSNVAHLHTVLGKLKDVAETFKIVLDIELKLYSGEHVNLGYTYNNIGGVLMTANNHIKALLLFNKAHSIFSNKLHSNNFLIAILEMNIAICLSATGEKNEAIATYKSSELKLLHHFDSLHRDVSLVRSNLAHCLYYNGNYKEAISYMKLAIEGYINNYGELDKETRELKANLKKMVKRTL